MKEKLKALWGAVKQFFINYHIYSIYKDRVMLSLNFKQFAAIFLPEFLIMPIGQPQIKITLGLWFLVIYIYFWDRKK